MAINKIVKTTFNAGGNLSKKFGLMTRAAARFGKTAIKSFRGANRAASKFRGITSGFLKAQVIGKGFQMLSQGIGSVVTGFIAFDKAALGATVRFKDIGPDAVDFNEQLKNIEKSARDAGATTEFTAAQAAESLDFLARAGFTSAEAMASLGSMINLATASGEDFASVADMSSDLMGAFGLAADTTAQKVGSLNRLNDVLVKSANSANVTIESMFETMKDAAPIGKQLGIELEEVAALTAIMGNAGIKGSQAGTALKNAFLKLAAGGDPVQSMLSAIGVSVDDGTGNMRKFTDILEDVGGATKEFGNLKVAKVLDTLFGKRAIAGASGLIENISNVKAFEQSLLSAGDTSKKTAEIMRTSIDAKLKSLGSAATEAGFRVLNAFRVDGKSGIDAMTEAIRNADMQPFVEGLKVLGSIAVGIGDAFFFVGDNIGFAFAKMAQFKDFIVDILPKSGFGADFDPEAGGSSASSPAPNAAEAQAKAQQSTFSGTLNVAGAPEGSTLTTEQSAPGFNAALLGAN